MLANRVISICILICAFGMAFAMLLESSPPRDEMWYSLLHLLQR